MPESPPPLPVDAILPELTRRLGEAPCVVLQAPTGAGKTTRVPPALLASHRRVLVLEPRRVAARAAAQRMAEEAGERLGETFGYQVRFERRDSARTRVLVVTPGILLRRLLDDPFLEDTAAIVFDEFHERALDADLALGLVRLLQQTVRPELRLLLMSATLDGAGVAERLSAPLVRSEGRRFPVDIRYRPRDPRARLELALAAAVEEALSATTGDVLAFLPGLGEIRRAARELDERLPEDVSICPLHGDLDLAAQSRALRRGEGRKVVLATNVAESSVTVEGVTAVVDSGLARELRFDPSSGLDRLELGPISAASADQRAGRAGRLAPGIALRLWSEVDQASRPARAEPEIRRVDLSAAALRLLAAGESDLAGFPWFEPPRPESLAQALALLGQLGALAGASRLSPLGERLSALPVHPRLGRLLLAGAERGVASRAALAAALLSERSPFQRDARDGPPEERLQATPSDVLDRVEALEAFERGRRAESLVGRLSPGPAKRLLRVRDQLRGLVKEARDDASDPDEALQRALLAAFPDRLARRREPGSRRAVLVGGRGLRLAPESGVLEPELFLALEVDARRGEALARVASGVERAWLDDERIVTEDEVSFDEASERLVARRRTRFEDLILDERQAALNLDEAAAQALARAAAERWERVRPSLESGFGQLVARLALLREQLPEEPWPEVSEESLKGLLVDLCRGRRSLDEVRGAPWEAMLRAPMSYELSQLLEREAPEGIALPTGRVARLRYEPGRPPVLAARIQELFGMHETPALARGRLPVLVHLLAPNQRVQQITGDLRSFWESTYAQVRKDLRGRYPKHAWPEDPWTAQAEDRPRRKR